MKIQEDAVSRLAQNVELLPSLSVTTFFHTLPERFVWQTSMLSFGVFCNAAS
jgi:hypothetical protein